MEAHQTVINRDEVIAREVKSRYRRRQRRCRYSTASIAFLPLMGGWRQVFADRFLDQCQFCGVAMSIWLPSNSGWLWPTIRRHLQIPGNLAEAAGNTSSRKGEISYWIGVAYQVLGDTAKAQQAWRDASADPAAPVTGGRGGNRRPDTPVGTAAPGQFSERNSLAG